MVNGSNQSGAARFKSSSHGVRLVWCKVQNLINVATTIVWQICGDMGMAGIIEAPGTVYYYVRLKVRFFTSAPLSD